MAGSLLLDTNAVIAFFRRDPVIVARIENDIWIAAIAVQHKLTVLSNDKHFDLVARLQREGW